MTDAELDGLVNWLRDYGYRNGVSETTKAADAIAAFRRERDEARATLARHEAHAYGAIYLEMVANELRAENEKLVRLMDQATSRGCNHCIDTIRPARAFFKDNAHD